MSLSFNVAMVIPTGIGAAQGGYGGDAMVWLNLLASVCDTLITHPNVANAAAFQALPPNALYVEGYGLDQFFKGQWGLQPVRAQKVGVILDAGLESGMKILQQNTLNAVKTVYGVPIIGFVETTEPLDLGLHQSQTGASGGRLGNPTVLLEAAQKLLAQGATAIALCAQMHEPQDSTYAQAVGADPIGGLEAILSHYLVSELQVPCANAPCFNWEEAQPRRDALVDPKTASEYISATFLPCVLTGLHKAPNFMPLNGTNCLPHPLLTLDNLNALVTPVDALGGVGPLSCLEQKIPVITVASNTTVLNVTAERLLGQAQAHRYRQQGLLIEAQSYPEAVGLLQLLKLGLQPF